PVQLRDHLLDGVDDVGLDQAGVGKRLLDQRGDRVLDLGCGALGARLEGLLEQRREVVGLALDDERVLLGIEGVRRHDISLPIAYALPSPSPPCCDARSLSVAISCGSASSLRSDSSAATLPSM